MYEMIFTYSLFHLLHLSFFSSPHLSSSFFPLPLPTPSLFLPSLSSFRHSLPSPLSFSSFCHSLSLSPLTTTWMDICVQTSNIKNLKNFSYMCHPCACTGLQTISVEDIENTWDTKIWKKSAICAILAPVQDCKRYRWTILRTQETQKSEKNYTSCADFETVEDKNGGAHRMCLSQIFFTKS